MHKTKMYECTVFFATGYPKTWKYVRDLKSFAEFLNRDHPLWKYFNVYEKGSKKYLRRFYFDNVIPKVLTIILFLLIQKFTSSELSDHRRNCTLENTFEKTTFMNGFIISTTIPTRSIKKTHTLCS